MHCFHEIVAKIAWEQISVISTCVHTAQCGKMRNLLSPKDIPSNQLVLSFVKHCFHKIFAKNAWEQISVISTVCSVL